MPDASSVEITVVVRSHNDRGTIRDTLAMLSEQTLIDRMEILAFDDDSTDGTLDIISSFPRVRLMPWDRLPYNPPRVLNRAVAAAKGKFIVFNNSDAAPCTRDAVERLVTPLFNPAVGAVFGNQFPRPDAFPLVQKDYERAFGDGSTAAKWGNMFSLVFSAVRTDTARKFKFDEAFQYSEDIEWSVRLRAAGLRIVYRDDAAVVHSHNYPPHLLRKRFYNEGRANGMIFKRKPSLVRTLLGITAESFRDFLYLARHHALDCLSDGFRYRAAQRLSCYAGEKDVWTETHSAKKA